MERPGVPPAGGRCMKVSVPRGEPSASPSAAMWLCCGKEHSRCAIQPEAGGGISGYPSRGAVSGLLARNFSRLHVHIRGANPRALQSAAGNQRLYAVRDHSPPVSVGSSSLLVNAREWPSQQREGPCQVNSAFEKQRNRVGHGRHFSVRMLRQVGDQRVIDGQHTIRVEADLGLDSSLDHADDIDGGCLPWNFAWA
jgi:hypothetical protein